MRNPGVSRGPFNQNQDPKSHLTAQRNLSLSHGGERLGGQTHYRILRSSSAYTASDIHKPRNSTIRKDPTICHFPPLSQAPTHFPNPSHHQVSGPTASMSIVDITENGTNLHHHRKRARHRLSEKACSSKHIPRSRVSILLSRARESIERDAGHLGRKPSIMDVILDLKSSQLNYDYDDLTNVIRSRELRPGRREYTFTDEQSLVTYWADQAVIWDGMRMIEAGTTTRFPDSGERSTVAWTSSLNECRSDD